MALSPIEDSYLQRLTSSQFPDMPASEPAMPVDSAALDAPSMDGMQLAAGPSQTVSDAGAGRGSYAGFDPRLDIANKGQQDQMRAYDPTTRERIASFLQAGFEGLGMDRYKARQNAQTLIGGGSSNLPLDMGLADIVPFLGTALQTEEAVNMGGEAVQSAKQGNYGTAALQAGGAVLGLVPGAAGTVKAAKGLKNLPVGLSTQAVGGMSGVLTPTAKATAPVNDMGFYSAVEQAALNVPRKSGTGQAFLNDITKGENVKADEIKWIGLDDFLKGKKNVSREEVQQFIAANKVDVQEVQFGNMRDQAAQKEQDAAGKLVDLINSQDGSSIRLAGTQGKVFSDEALYALQDKTSVPSQFPPEFQEAASNYLMAYEAAKGASNTDTRFGRYTLPGGDNYREILLTMPAFGEDVQKLNDISMRIHGMPYTEIMADTSEMAKMRLAVKREYKSLYGESGKTAEDRGMYRSNHWEQPNVLAHIRVNDRVDADGKKMLLVEEVQSDWHQAGRDKGYKGNPSQEAIDAGLKQAKAMGYSDEQIAEMNPQTISSFTSAGSQSVPDAPMKDTWYQLALKRVLKYAADNGYERVGLTTGKTNAERFDLSKQVERVISSKEDGGFRIFARDTNGKNHDMGLFSEAKLPDVVGKDLAKKITSQTKDTETFEGVDLKVGGEGMKKYYDEIYPQFLAKYGKKWGAKVGDTSVPTERSQDASGIPSRYPQQEPVRFVDITPEMRQGVGKGQPLFTATGIGAGTTGATMQDKEQK